ncbi:MAG: methionyl-tRNA formyltransferase [Verrucomicrobiae bacterium]|jgi:methionyl-tRNA formyltransferase|nr:methionyl-tRNA formyltransferase [Verrucomicrobiae bacterium]
MRILFAGTSSIGEQAMRAVALHYELIGLLTQPDRLVGRHQELKPPALKESFLKIAPGAPILQPENLRSAEAINSLQALHPDVIVTMSYGKIVPPEILTLPTHACLNIHASLLPRHRGASPIQSAIIAGDTHSGITIMYMDEGLDTGDILLTKKIPITSRETSGTLSEHLAELSPIALLEALDLLKKGSAPRFPQTENERSITHRIHYEDAALDWSSSAITVERLIRAMNPKPGAHGVVTLPSGKKSALKIFSALVRPSHNKESQPGSFFLSEEQEILLCCKEGALLLEEVQPLSRARMTFSAFARGNGINRNVIC